MGLDTIDIEDLANQFGEDFVAVTTKAVMGAVYVKVPWLAGQGNFFGKVVQELVEFIVQYIGHNLGLIAFQFNTYVWTTDQGQDYIASVEKRRAMPEDVSDEDWMKAEEEANHAFFNLWNLKR